MQQRSTMTEGTKNVVFNGTVVSPARSAAADAMLSFLGKASPNMPTAFFSHATTLLPANVAPNSLAQRIRGSFSPLKNPPIITNENLLENESTLVSTPLHKLRGINPNNSSGENMFDGFLSETTKSGRKEKSLGLLCQKFLLLYSTLKQSYISLDIAAKNLGVERRRMYDVVNVLESISIVSKRAKNCYCWHGYGGIQARIHEIKNAKENDPPLRTPTVQGNSLESSNIATDSVRRSLTNLHSISVENKPRGGGLSLPVSPITSTTHVTAHTGKSEKNRNKGKAKVAAKTGPSRRLKSLGRLSCRFISLFLNYKSVLSLEEAAQYILKSRCEGGDVTAQLLRTKIRRLYDVANVLSSIGMVVKCKKITKTDKYSEGGRKPAFKWVGSVNEVFKDQKKVSSQLEVLKLIDGIVEDPADAKYCSIDEKKKVTEDKKEAPIAPEVNTTASYLHDGSDANAVESSDSSDAAISPSSSSTMVEGVRPAMVSDDALSSEARVASLDIPTQEVARLSRASAASVRATSCGESFQTIWSASKDGDGRPPDPYKMLRFRQAQLKEFMRNYCAHWHSWKQKARDRDLKRAAHTLPSAANAIGCCEASKRMKGNPSG